MSTTRHHAVLHPHVPHFVRSIAETLRHDAAVVPAEVMLHGDGVHSVHVHEPMEFALLQGEVLVTVEGDVEDHVVAAGETFRTERAGHHVIAAVRPSRVRIARR